MTENIYFDNDCLSSFLWVGKENLLVQLYKSRIFLPQQVYDELKFVPFLQLKVENQILNNEINLCQIIMGSLEADLYIKLTTNPDPGYYIIGKGEASAIALSVINNGILGSNNMKDISPYIKLYHIRNITTGLILEEAFQNGLITESEGNTLWSQMIAKRRKLPESSFSVFLAKRKGI